MPSISRHYTLPTVIQSASSKTSSSCSHKERAVGFLADPVSSLSRPVNPEESWAAYDFEMHARKCAYCHNPYEVHRSHGQLCDLGHKLAQLVARYLYNRSSETYSTVEEDHKLVRVEIPSSYEEVRSLLKAIERSLRSRRSTPFVSMDHSYYVSARVPLPTRTRSVKIEQASKTKPRPRSGEIVDWPDVDIKPITKVTTEVHKSSSNKRGSLYEQDRAEHRRNAQKYSVEVREPTARDLREHRLSGYYR
ncbi:hypothetical protein GQ43DRAFT_439395 [Delitschia confertaspora ATCC 74209]|uniref:Uncharacterized protein n=1 Tax=Delitschia confertaspora ATCC 74209 TaxID=1513339 RepID=A0A9P4JNR7_9PLEO|nr:hypothetical protein GQ43DRAFT_439395 [Delitschia confertaspora ATCC 74209]